MRSFTEPIAQIAQISNILQGTIAAAERVFEFLAEAEEIPDTDNPISVANFEGRVDFKNVVWLIFYRPRGPMVGVTETTTSEHRITP